MKQITTILCCTLFLLSGILIIRHTKDRDGPSLFPGNMSAYATPQLVMPSFPLNKLPLDLQLDLNKRAIPDTVFVNDTIFINDTIFKIKYKTKIQKVVEPKVVEKQDTLLVPVFYIATPLEHEVESTEIRVIDNVQVNCQSETNQTDSIYIND